MQYASDRSAKNKANLMRLEMNSMRMHEDSLAASMEDEDNTLSEHVLGIHHLGTYSDFFGL